MVALSLWKVVSCWDFVTVMDGSLVDIFVTPMDGRLFIMEGSLLSRFLFL